MTNESSLIAKCFTGRGFVFGNEKSERKRNVKLISPIISYAQIRQKVKAKGEGRYPLVSPNFYSLFQAKEKIKS